MENIEKSTVLSLNDAVSYLDKSVVSKQVIKAPAGNVTLFAFDVGEGLSEHTAPFDALVQIVDGQAEIILGGKSHIVKNGEFIIMPAHVQHALIAHEKFKMMLVMIKS